MSGPRGWARVRSGEERGAAAIELALIAPALVMLAAGATFVVSLVLHSAHLTQVSETGARYATRVAPDPTRAGPYRVRPTAAEVEEEVRRLARVALTSVEVVPDPAGALPGTPVSVTVRSHVPLGPLGRAMNGLAGAFAGMFGAGPPLPPEGFEIASTTVMREE